MAKRQVFIVSDRTGITAEMQCHSLLSQFPGYDFEYHILPFVDSNKKIERAAEAINKAAAAGIKPLVFTTIINDEMRGVLNTADGEFFDFFDRFIAPLERVLGETSSHSLGMSHGMADGKRYTSRISAVNYSVHCDDGMHPRDYDRAEVIIIGVSRSGKTPTSLYLALHFGIFAANYPITDADLDSSSLPEILMPWRDKLFGMTIDPVRLQQIRQERRANSRYSELAQCRFEVSQVEQMFQQEKVSYVDATAMSIEEISTKLLQEKSLNREFF